LVAGQGRRSTFVEAVATVPGGGLEQKAKLKKHKTITEGKKYDRRENKTNGTPLNTTTGPDVGGTTNVVALSR